MIAPKARSEFGVESSISPENLSKIVQSFSEHVQSSSFILPSDVSVSRLGPSPPDALGELRDKLSDSVLYAAGIPPSLLSSDAPGTASRESYRQLLHGTIRPLGMLVAEELKAKLDPSCELTFDNLKAGDVASTARAFRGLVDAGTINRASRLNRGNRDRRMINYFGEVVTPPTALPITVAAADMALAAAVVEEIERAILWRGLVAQTRRITLDGPLPPRIELEPITAIVSLTKWTPTDAAAVLDADSYDFVSRDPLGATIFAAPGKNWPAPERDVGSFSLVYSCGWEVSPESAPGVGNAVNEVPASVQLMVERAIAFRAGSGLGDLRIGSFVDVLGRLLQNRQNPA